VSSFQERMAARREYREQVHTFELPVLGYEDIGLYARYKVLPYEELRAIGKSNEKVAETVEGELAIAADTLIRACVGLLEKTGETAGRPEYRELGCRWDPKGVREKLGVEVVGDTARAAIFAVFNGPSGGNELSRHFLAYDAETEKVNTQIDEEQLGEFVGTSEPEVLLTSQ
jgi:hypothetical protein